MTTLSAGESLAQGTIEYFEEYIPTVYLDPKGIPTIGFGQALINGSAAGSYNLLSQSTVADILTNQGVDLHQIYTNGDSSQGFSTGFKSFYSALRTQVGDLNGNLDWDSYFPTETAGGATVVYPSTTIVGASGQPQVLPASSAPEIQSVQVTTLTGTKNINEIDVSDVNAAQIPDDIVGNMDSAKGAIANHFVAEEAGIISKLTYEDSDGNSHNVWNQLSSQEQAALLDLGYGGTNLVGTRLPADLDQETPDLLGSFFEIEFDDDKDLFGTYDSSGVGLENRRIADAAPFLTAITNGSYNLGGGSLMELAAGLAKINADESTAAAYSQPLAQQIENNATTLEDSIANSILPGSGASLSEQTVAGSDGQTYYLQLEDIPSSASLQDIQNNSGFSLASLQLVNSDNPLVTGTGTSATLALPTMGQYLASVGLSGTQEAAFQARYNGALETIASQIAPSTDPETIDSSVNWLSGNQDKTNTPANGLMFLGQGGNVMVVGTEALTGSGNTFDVWAPNSNNSSATRISFLDDSSPDAYSINNGIITYYYSDNHNRTQVEVASNDSGFSVGYYEVPQFASLDGGTASPILTGIEQVDDNGTVTYAPQNVSSDLSAFQLFNGASFDSQETLADYMAAVGYSVVEGAPNSAVGLVQKYSGNTLAALGNLIPSTTVRVLVVSNGDALAVDRSGAVSQIDLPGTSLPNVPVSISGSDNSNNPFSYTATPNEDGTTATESLSFVQANGIPISLQLLATTGVGGVVTTTLTGIDGQPLSAQSLQALENAGIDPADIAPDLPAGLSTLLSGVVNTYDAGQVAVVKDPTTGTLTVTSIAANNGSTVSINLTPIGSGLIASNGSNTSADSTISSDFNIDNAGIFHSTSINYKDPNSDTGAQVTISDPTELSILDNLGLDSASNLQTDPTDGGISFSGTGVNSGNSVSTDPFGDISINGTTAGGLDTEIDINAPDDGVRTSDITLTPASGADIVISGEVGGATPGLITALDGAPVDPGFASILAGSGINLASIAQALNPGASSAISNTLLGSPTSGLGVLAAGSGNVPFQVVVPNGKSPIVLTITWQVTNGGITSATVTSGTVTASDGTQYNLTGTIDSSGVHLQQNVVSVPASTLIGNTVSAAATAAIGELISLELGNDVPLSETLQALSQTVVDQIHRNVLSLDLKGLEGFGSEFATSLAGAFGGYAGGQLGADLAKDLGIDPQIGGILGSQLGSYGAEQAEIAIVDKIFQSSVPPAAASSLSKGAAAAAQIGNISLATNIEGAFAAFAGEELADAITTGNPIGSAIGSTLGGAGGSFAGYELALGFGVSFGPVGFVVGAFIGAFLGDIFGGLFGPGRPNPSSIATLSLTENDTFAITHIGHDHADSAIGESMGTSAINAVNGILSEIGGRIANILTLPTFNFGLAGWIGSSDTIGYIGADGEKFSSMAAALDHGVLTMLRSIQIEGGDPYLKQALYASDATTVSGLISDLQVAKDYELYAENPILFDASIASSADPSAGQQWAAVLARAVQLGLPDATDASSAYNNYSRVADTAAYWAGHSGQAPVAAQAGSNTISVQGNTQILDTGNGVDVLNATGFANILQGGSEADTLNANGMSNTVTAGSGNATINTTGTDNTSIAGSGVDVLIASGSSNVLMGGSGTASLSATGNDNILVAQSGSATLNASGSGNILHGGTGHDILEVGGNDNGLTAGSGSDTLTATGNSNILQAGAGNDTLSATGDGNDVLGATGNVTLVATGDGNILAGGSGDVTFIVSGDDNTITGGTGTNTVSVSGEGNIVDVSAGDAVLSVTGDNNSLIGSTGSDTLIASGKNEFFNGGAGNDTYIGHGTDTIWFDATYGQDTLLPGTNDTILFAADISPDDVDIQANGSDLLIKIAGTNASIDVENELNPGSIGGVTSGLETLKFSDGTTEALTLPITATFDGSAGDQTLSGDNYVARNVFLMGAGDTLIGGAESNTYILNTDAPLGTTSLEETILPGGDDTLVLGPVGFASPVSRGTVEFQTQGSDLLITLGSLGETIDVKDDIVVGWSGVLISKIKEIEFADGSFLDVTDPQVFASYIFNKGSGSSSLTPSVGETIEFGADIIASDVLTHRVGNDLIITLSDTGDSLDVVDNFGGTTQQPTAAVKTLKFLSDGTTWNSDLSAAGYPGVYTAQNLALLFDPGGTPQYLESFAGQTLSSANATNLYFYDAGTGSVSIDPGTNDTLEFGVGISTDDVVPQADGNNLVIKISNSDDVVTVNNDLSLNGQATVSSLKTILFADGTILDLTQPLTFMWDGSAGNAILTGDSFGANIFRAGAGDTIYGAEGGSNFYELDTGEGTTTILPGSNDTVSFSAGVSPDDVNLQADGSDLILTINSTGATFRFVNDLSEDSNTGIVSSLVKTVNFSNGTSWNLNQGLVFTLDGTAGHSSLTGSSYGRNLFKGGIDDSFVGGSDGNTYFFDSSVGSTTITPNAGDIIELGASFTAGEVTLQANGSDLLINLGSEGSIDLVGDLGLSGYATTSKADQIQFSNGSSIDLSDGITAIWDGSSGNKNLTGDNDTANLFYVGMNDTITGGGGDNTYYFASADGQVTINPGQADTIKFGPNILPEDVTVAQNGSTLNIAIGDNGDSISILNNFNIEVGGSGFGSSYNSVLSAITFADGTKWDVSAILAINSENAGSLSDTLMGSFSNDAVSGNSAVPNFFAPASDDTLTFDWDGTAGDKTLMGVSSGENIFLGGANDSLTGGVGSNVYIFDNTTASTSLAGIGNSTIIPGADDTLEIGSTITVSDATLQISGTDLILNLGSAGSIDLAEDLSFAQGASSSLVKEIVFGDGSSLDLSQGVMTVWNGVSGDQSFMGDANTDNLFEIGPNDTAVGGDGTNIYFIANPDGLVTITPGEANIIEFGVNITSSDVSLHQNNSNLIIDIGGSGNEIDVLGDFSSGQSAIGTIAFANGTIWDVQSVLAGDEASEGGIASFSSTIIGSDGSTSLLAAVGILPVMTWNGTAGNQTLSGLNLSDNVFQGGANDTLMGGDGTDTYIFGDAIGNATIAPGADDTIEFSSPALSASDVTVEAVGNEIILEIGNSGDRINLVNDLSDDNGAASSLVKDVLFADGSSIDLSQGIMATWDGSAGFESLIGDNTTSNLFEIGTDDTVTGGTGENRYYIDSAVSDVTITPGDSDVIEFGSDIQLSGIFLKQSGSSLILEIGSSANTVTVLNNFGPNHSAVSAVAFANGTIWDVADIIAAERAAGMIITTVTGSNGDDTLAGTYTDEYQSPATNIYTYSKGEGDVTIVPNSDTVDVTAGNLGVLELGPGITESDVAFQTDSPGVEAGADGTLTIKILDTGKSITIENDITTWNFLGVFYWQQAQIGQIQFADGTVLDATKLTDTWIASMPGETLSGTNLASNLFELGPDSTAIGETPYDYATVVNTYLFDRGDGGSTIIPNGGNGTLEIAADISTNDILYQTDAAGDLTLRLKDTGDSVTIANEFSYPGQSVQITNIVAADGTSIDPAFIVNTWIGSSTETTLIGSDWGPNLFEFGAGGDTAIGGIETHGRPVSNIYVFDRSDGGAVIDPNGGSGTLLFGADIESSDVIYQTDASGDLTLRLADTGETVTIESEFGFPDQSEQITSVEFADGTVIDPQEVVNTWIGTISNTTLIGSNWGNNLFDLGVGGDVAIGGAAIHGNPLANTYNFSVGDGHATINLNGVLGSLEFGVGITSTTVSASLSGTNIILTPETAGDGVTLIDGLSALQSNQLVIEFSDGSIWTSTHLFGLLENSSVNNTILGTTGSDSLIGGDGPYVFDGKGGNDYENDQGGNDTFVFNQGYGRLEISESDLNSADVNILQLGAGISPADIVVTADSGNDIYLTIGNQGDRVELDSMLGNSRYGVQEVVFAGSTVWTAQQITAMEMTGTTGADNIFGTAGSDLIDGKGDGDYEQGDGGNDTFVFNQGYGRLEISESDSNSADVNILQLGAGISPADIVVTADSDNDIYLTISNQGDRIRLDNMLGNAQYGVQEVIFADTTVWTAQQITAMEMIGTTGADNIFGTAGSNLIDGKGDGDYEQGDGGNDTFVFNQGYGRLEIDESDSNSADVNILQLGAGISPADIAVTADSDHDIYLTIGNRGDRVELDNMLGNAQYGVQEVVFADTTVWTAQYVASLVSTFPGQRSQQLIGAPGQHLLDTHGADGYVSGTGGGDTFVFNKGYGPLEISELDQTSGDINVLTLGAGISVSDVVVTTDGVNDIYLTIGNRGDRIELDNMLNNPQWGVQEVIFADSTVWTAQQITEMVLTGTTGPDSIFGTFGADVIDGKGGADYEQGNGGGDTFVFNKGYGQLEISELDQIWGDINVLSLGAGISPSDVVVTTDGGDNIYLTIGNRGDRVQLDNMQNNPQWGVQEVIFADNTVWTAQQITEMALTGTTGPDSIFGTSGADVIDGKGGADYEQGNGGGDTFVFNKGYGQLEISELDQTSGDINVLALGAGVSPDDIVITNDGSNVYLTIGNWGDRIELDAMLSDSQGGVQKVTFSDNTVWNESELEALIGIATFTWNGTGGGAVLVGNDLGENIFELGPNDTITGAPYGGSGRHFSNTYEIDGAFGGTTITAGTTGNDIIVFGAGISSNDFTLQASGSNLLLTDVETHDQLKLVGHDFNWDIPSELIVMSGGVTTASTVSNGGVEFASSGGIISAAAVYSGGLISAVSGGSTSDAILNSGGQEAIGSGGVANETTILSGGTMNVAKGGTASGTLISSGGTQIVSSGAIANGTAILSGGAETVLAGGTAVDAVISGGGADIISSGGIASSTTILAGGTEYVSTGGTAVSAILSGGGKQIVSSGATASGTTIMSGGSEIVSSGGALVGAIIAGGVQYTISAGMSALATVVSSGGSTTVLSGGYDSGTVLSDSGNETIFANGSAISSFLYAGGNQYVSSGGVASGTTVLGGGFEYVSSGGLATGAILSATGSQIVMSGGAAVNTTVLSGGVEVINPGGSATGTILSGGGLEHVSSGGVASGTMVYSGSLGIGSGGLASGTQVLFGGTESVSAGAVASSTVVSSGGVQVLGSGTTYNTTVLLGGSALVSSGGNASGTIVNSGGIEVISTGGHASGTRVNSSGSLQVSSGGVELSGTVGAGGVETILATGTASGTTISGKENVSAGGIVSAVTVASGGTLTLYTGAVVSGGVTLSGGTAVISGTLGTGRTVTFAGAGGDLVLVSPTTFASEIGGFNPTTQEIDLKGFAYSAGETVSWTEAGTGTSGTLTVVDGAKTATLNMLGSYVTSNFTLSTDGAGGTMLPNGVANGKVVLSGTTETVSSGSTLYGAVVNGGIINVLSGGIASSVGVNTGAVNISAGGIASMTTVSSGGDQYISSGGVASGTTVLSGGFEYVSSGGTACGTTLSAVGSQVVMSGGAAVNTTVLSGGVEVINPGGSATGTILSGGGLEHVSSGGVASGTMVYSGSLGIGSGGLASGTQVLFGGTESVSAGAVASSTVVSSGGVQVLGSGTTYNTTVLLGGSALVSSGGNASGTIVNSGGIEVISTGGHASGTTVNSGGSLQVSSGGIELNGTVGAGGVETILATGTARGTTISGKENVSAAGIVSAVTVASGGTLTLYTGAVVSGGFTLSGGTAVVSGTLGTGRTVTFSGAGGDLVLVSPTTFASEIGGFNLTTQEIDLKGFAYSAGETVSWTEAGTGTSGTLTVVDGAKTATLNMLGSSATSSFALTTDLAGGTILSNTGIISGMVILSGAIENVSSGSRLIGAVVSGGIVNVLSGGIASAAVVNTGAINISTGGIASMTTVSNGGDEYILSGGVATGTTVSGGGWEVISSSGTGSGVTVLIGGAESIVAGSILSGNTISSGGGLYLYSGAVPSGVTLASGSFEYFEPGTTVTSGTILDGTNYIAGLASGVLISNGISAQIVAGGTVSATRILAGGNEYVSSGGTASGTVISAGGAETIYTGGADDIATVFGAETVSGGTASGVTVSSGGAQYILSGGTASATTILAGGELFVSFGGTAAGITVSSGGGLCLYAGAIVSSATLASGSYEYFEAGTTVTNGAVLDTVDYIGGVASGIVISAGLSDIVLSGGIASSTSVSSGGLELVSSGGTTSGTVVSNGGNQAVSSGGTASSTIVSSGGGLTVLSSGTTVSAAVNASGIESVSSGGTASGTTAFTGGSVNVSAGGATVGTIVSNGGKETIFANGSANSTSVYAGGNQYISSGGVASGTTVLSGGFQYVSSGGLATGAILSATGSQVVMNGGTAVNTNVLSGGAEIISAGGSTTGTVLSGGGTEHLSSGGIASGTLVYSGSRDGIGSGGLASGTQVQFGGIESISAGGVASSTMVSSGGVQALGSGTTFNTTVLLGGSALVSSGGNASGTIVNSGGIEVISTGGHASATNVYSGGSLQVSSGGIELNGTVMAGGVETILATGTARGTTISGNEYVSAGGTASAVTVESGGTLTLYTGAVVSGGVTLSGGTAVVSGTLGTGRTVTFAGDGGDLVLVSPSTFASEIGGFNLTTQKIDLKGFAYSAGETASWTEAGTNTSGTLTVVDGAKTATLNMLGSYVTSNFVLSTDGAGGTYVVDPPVPSVSDADLHQLIDAMASYGGKGGPVGNGYLTPPDPNHLPYLATHH